MKKREGFVDSKLNTARDLLAARIEEIDQERAQLLAALERLNELPSGSTTRAATAAETSKRGSKSRGPRRTARTAKRQSGRSSRSRSSANGKGHRAARGQREQQLVSSIKANPGLRVSEYARRVGVKPQQLYPILDRLMERDMVEKTDRTYKLKTPAA